VPQIRSLIVACLVMLAAAACDDLAQDAACSDICEKLRDCTSNMSVNSCTTRCVDSTIDKRSLRDMTEDCADCIEDYTCRDVASRCGVCNDVLELFSSYRFEDD